MNEKQKREMENLYSIFSPSRNEKIMADYVEYELRVAGVEYNRFHHFIYNFRKDAPMICAHMDQVKTKQPIKALKYNKKGTTIRAKGGAIGADDKNGVWILLQILRDPKYFNKISFIFSTGEETGGEIDILLGLQGVEVTNKIPYCLVFDRQGKSDIIGPTNGYCKSDLIQDAYDVMLKYGYSEAIGFWSDCDLIASFIPCVNISTGSYRPHHDDDYTVIPQMENSLAFGMALLDTLKGRYKLGDPTVGFYHGSTTTVYEKKDGKWNEYNGPVELDDNPCGLCEKYDCEGCDKWDNPFYGENEEYDGEGYRLCPECDSDMTQDSPYNIGDSICVQCGAVYDELDGMVHFIEDWKGKTK